jgi:flagellar hook-associated protein 2
MSSGVTFSSFNSIDWNSILNAVMAQEQQPVTALQQRQSTLTARSTSFSTLGTKVGAVEDVLTRLSKSSSLTSTSITNSDASVATVTGGTDLRAGKTYDIDVIELARAQVTSSTTLFDNTGTQVAVTTGTLDIDRDGTDRDVHITIDGLTLEQIRDRINGTDGVGLMATIVSPSSGKYALVLTGDDAGDAGRFSVGVSGAVGGKGLDFGANAVDAHDAHIRINQVDHYSPTNKVEDAIPGATVTLKKKGGSTTVAVSADQNATKTALSDLVRTYNDLRGFVTAQTSATDASKIGHDPLLRGLMTQLRSGLTTSLASGAVRSLTDVGITFSRNGDLAFSESTFTAAAANPQAITQLFMGTEGAPGIFGTLKSAINAYTEAGGLIADARTRLDAQAKSVGTQIQKMQERLELRRQSLQAEYNAADRAMTALNSQTSALSSIGQEYRLF